MSNREEFERQYNFPYYIKWSGKQYICTEYYSPVKISICMDYNIWLNNFRAGAKSRDAEIEKLREALEESIQESNGLHYNTCAVKDFLMQTEDDKDFIIEEVFELLGYHRNGLVK